MDKAKAHLVFPQELLDSIDKLVGKRKRSKFVVEAAQKELKRLQLQRALEKAAGAWKDENHPALKKKGAYQWVRDLREEAERRFKEIPD